MDGGTGARTGAGFLQGGSEGRADSKKVHWGVGGGWQMTAEGLRLSLACPHGDRVSESWRGGRGTAVRWLQGERNLYDSFVTGPCGDAGGRAALLAMRDRYRQESRRQNLHP